MFQKGFYRTRNGSIARVIPLQPPSKIYGGIIIFGPPTARGKIFRWDQYGNCSTVSEWDLMEFLRIQENGFGDISLQEILKNSN